MSGWISFLCFVLLGAADTVFSVKLNLSPWQFLLAGNPVQPDGRRVYDTERFQPAAGMLCAIYAGVFFMTALSVLLTQILCVLPGGLMAAMLYDGKVCRCICLVAAPLCALCAVCAGGLLAAGVL